MIKIEGTDRNIFVPYTGATTNVDLGTFNLTTTGTGTFTTLDVTGGATFNSFGGDNDFLIKANNVDNQFRIDAGTNTVNIGNVTPSIAYTWLGEGRTGVGGGGTADDGGGMRFDAGVGYSYTSGVFSTAGDGGRINFYAGTGGAVSGVTLIGIGGPGGEARMTSGDGGASSGSATITQIGGNAGDFYFYSGDGGKGTNSVGASTGGQAGDFQLVAGGGGDADGTGTVNRGGAGAEIFFTAGGGGDAANGSTSNTGGGGGDITFTAGRRGTGATANGAEGKISFATGGSTRWTIDGSGHLLAATDGMGAYNITTTGTINNAADNAKHTWGAAGATDSYIQFGGTNLEFYSSGGFDFGSTIIVDYDLASGNKWFSLKDNGVEAMYFSRAGAGTVTKIWAQGNLEMQAAGGTVIFAANRFQIEAGVTAELASYNNPFIITTRAGTHSISFQPNEVAAWTIHGTSGDLLSGAAGAGIQNITTAGTVTAGASTFGDGGTTNYANFAADGEISLHGTARYYDGIEVDATSFKEPPANSATKVNRGLDIAYEFDDAQDAKHIHAAVRIPSKWVDTEDISVILIWSSPTQSAGCDWEVRYLFIAADEDTTNTTTEGTVSGIFTSSATANGLVHSTVTIPTADFDAGDKRLVFEVYRDGDDASDTLSASAFLQGIMVRGTANKLGGSL